MIQVGDMVRTLSDECPCSNCEELRGEYCPVVGTSKTHLRIKLSHGSLEFPRHWKFDVQAAVQENE